MPANVRLILAANYDLNLHDLGPHYKVFSLRLASEKRHISSLRDFELLQVVSRLQNCLGFLTHLARTEEHSLSVRGVDCYSKEW